MSTSLICSYRCTIYASSLSYLNFSFCSFLRVFGLTQSFDTVSTTLCNSLDRLTSCGFLSPTSTFLTFSSAVNLLASDPGGNLTNFASKFASIIAYISALCAARKSSTTWSFFRQCFLSPACFSSSLSFSATVVCLTDQMISEQPGSRRSLLSARMDLRTLPSAATRPSMALV